MLLIRIEEARFTGFPLTHSTRNAQSSFPFSANYWIGLDCNAQVRIEFRIYDSKSETLFFLFSSLSYTHTHVQDAQNLTATVCDVIATFRKTDAMDITAKLRKPSEAQALAAEDSAKDESDHEEDEEEQEEGEGEGEVAAGGADEQQKPGAAASGGGQKNSKGRWAPHKQRKYKRVNMDSLNTGGAEPVPKVGRPSGSPPPPHYWLVPFLLLFLLSQCYRSICARDC